MNLENVVIPKWSGCSLVVEIVRFVDEAFPGWVECQIRDAAGQLHTFIEKVPGVTTAAFDSSNTYPQAGSIRCEVLNQWSSESGQTLVRVSTEKPDHIESTNGSTEFTVMPTQILRDQG